MAYSPEERETVIQMDDAQPDTMIIFTAQRKMITKLLRNPLFVLDSQELNDDGRVITLKGTLPSKCLTIRTKRTTGGQGNVEGLKRWRESQKE